MKRLIATAAVSMTLSATGATASSFDGIVDFSGFSNNQIVQILDLGGGVTASVTVTNGQGGEAAPGEARIFSTQPIGSDVATNTANDPDLVADPFANSAGGAGRSFGNALIIQERAGLAAAEGPDDERRGGTVFFDFGESKIDLKNLFYLDGEEGFSVVANMTELGSGAGGDDEFTLLDFSDSAGAKGISRFAVEYNGSGAIGEFEVSLSSVPVPAGLPLLLSAFGAFALFRRRRITT